MGIIITTPRPGTDFAVLMTDSIADLSYYSYTAQVFPRLRYEARQARGDLFDALEEDDGSTWRVHDNITDQVLADFEKSFGTVTKDDIFYYVYGVMHSTEYRLRFSPDLQKALPRIPKVKKFQEFVTAGRALAALHLGYESAEVFPLHEERKVSASDNVQKMRYSRVGKIADKTAIIYNSGVTLSGIPAETYEYKIGARSALDWIIERYQVKTDKQSGIVNDPNKWGEEHGNSRYIIDLVGRIVTVSVETVKIVNSLPPLDLIP